MQQHFRWIVILSLMGAVVGAVPEPSPTTFMCPQKRTEKFDAICMEDSSAEVKAVHDVKIMLPITLRAKGRHSCSAASFKGKCCPKGLIPLPDPKDVDSVKSTVVAKCSDPAADVSTRSGTIVQ
ncbi:hypothetical protein PGT21_025589 [Puccinia graminis f. sp. tritici]|uniref:Hydrophobin n=1 Tax=Puccinia graminis f. sp. tritici TaxID=56615 RepID=A0A5B0M230_PUCGR|nr:hypothetical protein PGT21_025589 [Puccinia graminis f. sp. tritici]KAA1132600.1 hypothetical protein PGTUg99_011812 [Puccinia graminis f. sp. tritici]